MLELELDIEARAHMIARQWSLANDIEARAQRARAHSMQQAPSSDWVRAPLHIYNIFEQCSQPTRDEENAMYDWMEEEYSRPWKEGVASMMMASSSVRNHSAVVLLRAFLEDPFFPAPSSLTLSRIPLIPFPLSRPIVQDFVPGIMRVNLNEFVGDARPYFVFVPGLTNARTNLLRSREDFVPRLISARTNTRARHRELALGRPLRAEDLRRGF